MKLSRYLSALRRYWLLVAALTLVGVMAGFATGGAATTRTRPAATPYYATATLLVDEEGSTSGRTQSTSDVNLDKLYVLSADVAARAAQILGYTGPPSDLAATVTTASDTVVGSLAITATGTSAEEAAATADAFAQGLLAFLQEKNTTAHQAELDAADARVAALQQQLDATPPPAPSERTASSAQYDALASAYQEAFTELTTLRATTPSARLELAVAPVGLPGLPPVVVTPAAGGARPGETATESTDAVRRGSKSRLPRPVRGAAVGLVGFLLGLGLVFVLDRIDPRLRTGQDAEEAFGLPVLAEIPKQRRRARRGSKIVIGRRGTELVAEAYRQLRAVLFGSNPLPAAVAANGSSGRDSRTGGGPRTILVTAAAENESSSATVANLAAAVGESGRSVIAISTRFERDELPAYFSVPATPGLAEALEADPPTLEAVAKDAPLQGVRIVPSGIPVRSTAELATRAQNLVRALRDGPELVIIDAPPLLSSSATADLCTATDAVVVVCRAGHTTRGQAAAVSDRLALLGASVAGVVVVGTTGRTRRASPRVARPPEHEARGERVDVARDGEVVDLSVVPETSTS